MLSRNLSLLRHPCSTPSSTKNRLYCVVVDSRLTVSNSVSASRRQRTRPTATRRQDRATTRRRLMALTVQLTADASRCALGSARQWRQQPPVRQLVDSANAAEINDAGRRSSATLRPLAHGRLNVSDHPRCSHIHTHTAARLTDRSSYVAAPRAGL